MGRPLLPRQSLRNKLDIYLTDAEKSTVVEKASQAHLPVATFIRQIALGEKIVAVPQPNAVHWASLSRTVSNLNQLAHAANSGQVINVPAELLDDLREEVQSLRRSLLGVSA
jgi:hypothetical protein